MKKIFVYRRQQQMTDDQRKVVESAFYSPDRFFKGSPNVIFGNANTFDKKRKFNVRIDQNDYDRLNKQDNSKKIGLSLKSRQSMLLLPQVTIESPKKKIVDNQELTRIFNNYSKQIKMNKFANQFITEMPSELKDCLDKQQRSLEANESHQAFIKRITRAIKKKVHKEDDSLLLNSINCYTDRIEERQFIQEEKEKAEFSKKVDWPKTLRDEKKKKLSPIKNVNSSIRLLTFEVNRDEPDLSRLITQRDTLPEMSFLHDKEENKIFNLKVKGHNLLKEEIESIQSFKGKKVLYTKDDLIDVQASADFIFAKKYK